MKLDVEQITDKVVKYFKKAGFKWLRVEKVIPVGNNWSVTINTGIVIPVYHDVIFDNDGKILKWVKDKVRK